MRTNHEFICIVCSKPGKQPISVESKGGIFKAHFDCYFKATPEQIEKVTGAMREAVRMSQLKLLVEKREALLSRKARLEKEILDFNKELHSINQKLSAIGRI